MNITEKITAPYQLSEEVVYSEFKTSPNGLTLSEAQKRLQQGKNEITSAEKDSPFLLLIKQFVDPLIIILLISSAVSLSIGQFIEASAIFVIVLLAGILGFFQEYKAERAIEALQKMASPYANVIRNGKEKHIPSSEVVVGDIIIVSAGNTIPADARLVDAHNLQVNEAALTGESVPVEKNSEPILKNELPLGERKNMIFGGTFVTGGRGKAVVVATGMNTEFGKIASLLQKTSSRKTPLQQNLEKLGKQIGIAALLLAFVMALTGYFIEEKTFVEMFIWGVAVAVAIIPEALPAVVTISIALGVRRMAKRKALIRKLPAVETLGAVDIICSDKTGTLTQDQMTIREIFTNDIEYYVTGVGYKPQGNFRVNNEFVNPEYQINLMRLLEIGALCNDTVIDFDKGEEIIGDPTEAAFVVAALKAGIDYLKLRKKYPRVFEIPFSSETKMMTTVHLIDDDKLEAYTKGAFEIILDLSDKILINGIEKDLTEEEKIRIKQIAYQKSENALRILGVAYKKLNSLAETKDANKNLVFVGFAGMLDPPRKEVKKAIKTAFNAGIRPVVITGDYEVTAVAVAREVGILREGNSITGAELEQLNDEQLSEIIDHTEVFARITPLHKLRIVEAFMKKNHIVAMTGDGINDAPALKKADIGIAMGIKGTDVSREAADMILTDDNFASIVSAVEEGRSIFINIRKYLVYLLSGNLGAVLALILAMIGGFSIPLTAVQILFINFLMDGLVAIALGVEPPEKELMKRKPRKVHEGILNKRMIEFIIVLGILISVATFGIYYWESKLGFPYRKLMTVFFVTLVFSILFNASNCRSFDLPALSIKFYNNAFLLLSYIISVISTILVVEVNVFQEAFHTVSLSGGEWLASILVAAWVWILVEVYKILRLTFNESLITNNG